MYCFRVSFAMTVLLLACGGRLANEHVPMDGQRVRVLKSQKDVQNRYSFTVRVSGENGICSGVLISPHLVLAAAHCVCGERKEPTGEMIMDASGCQMHPGNR